MSAEPVLFEGYKGLDRFEDRGQRTDAFACISAGYKNEKGIPVASRDGTIYVSDPENRAPGLAAALKAGGGQRLTIAMPSNNPKEFISESFRVEGKTRLEAFGDADSITVIRPDGRRIVHKAGTPDYKAWREKSKVSTSIYFVLAEYDANGQPVLVYPDGMGLYRLRTTSPNTRDNLMAQLTLISRMTGGWVAGFPLEVSLANRNLSGPTGDKRNAPVFVFALKPPKALQLTSREFVKIAIGAKAETLSLAPQLMLGEARETIEMAIADFEEPPSCLETGLNPEQCRRRFFMACKDTHMDTKERREAFMLWRTAGATSSVKQFLLDATPEGFEALYDALVDVVKRPPVDFETGEALEWSPPAAEAFVGEAFGMDVPRDLDLGQTIETTATRVEPGPREPTDEELANQPPTPRMPVVIDVEEEDYDLLPPDEDEL